MRCAADVGGGGFFFLDRVFTGVLAYFFFYRS